MRLDNMVNKRTSHMCVPHRQSGTDRIHINSCTKSPTHVGQHAFRSKQCKTEIIMSRMVFWCHLKGLSPTACQQQEAAVLSTQITLKHELQFYVSHNGHIRRRSSCLICTLPTADDNVGGCHRLVIVGYGWSGHASVDRQLDSPHVAASLVYSAPLSSRI